MASLQGTRFLPWTNKVSTRRKALSPPYLFQFLERSLIEGRHVPEGLGVCGGGGVAAPLGKAAPPFLGKVGGATHAVGALHGPARPDLTTKFQ